MATSPNYGWLEPDNTDLVKNGALSIRTLGNAIDTTMATMTPKSTYTAKGSIAAATAASTPANLTVGNNGESLLADSSASTGLRWSGGNALPNPVLNSCMDIWQRGTSGAIASSVYTSFQADRWNTYRGSTGGTISRQATSDTTNLPNVQYCMRVQRDSGTTSTSFIQTINNWESVNSIPFAGKTVTFSFYARAGANYSAASSGLAYFLITGTGTDQNLNNGYTGQTSAISGTATLTTTWQRFTATATLSSSLTEIATGFSFTPVGTAGANDYYEVTGVQVDLGSVALPVRRYGLTLQAELAACQRYFIRTAAAANFGNIGVGQLVGITTGVYTVTFPTEMRITPSVTASAANTFVMTNGADSSSAVTTAPALNVGGKQTVCLAATASGLTGVAGQGSRLLINNAASGYVDFSGEL